MAKLIRIVDPHVEEINNEWGYPYEVSDTLLVDLDADLREYEIYWGEQTTDPGGFAKWFINKYS